MKNKKKINFQVKFEEMKEKINYIPQPLLLPTHMSKVFGSFQGELTLKINALCHSDRKVRLERKEIFDIRIGPNWVLVLILLLFIF
jgi:hypothetical protein